MPGRDAVHVASFAWSIGVVALLLRSGLIHQGALRTQPAPTDPLSLATAVLRNSDHFSSAAVGYAGTTPQEVLAWGVIFRSPRRDHIFEDLLATASLSGQLYALAGLRLGAPADFARAAAWMRGNAGMVRTVRGCIVSTEAIGEIVDQIEQGAWTRDFLERRLVPLLPR